MVSTGTGRFSESPIAAISIPVPDSPTPTTECSIVLIPIYPPDGRPETHSYDLDLMARVSASSRSPAAQEYHTIAQSELQKAVGFP